NIAVGGAPGRRVGQDFDLAVAGRAQAVRWKVGIGSAETREANGGLACCGPHRPAPRGSAPSCRGVLDAKLEILGRAPARFDRDAVDDQRLVRIDESRLAIRRAGSRGYRREDERHDDCWVAHDASYWLSARRSIVPALYRPVLFSGTSTVNDRSLPCRRTV